MLLAENPETSDGSIRELLERRQMDLIICPDGIDAVRKAYLRKPGFGGIVGTDTKGPGF